MKEKEYKILLTEDDENLGLLLKEYLVAKDRINSSIKPKTLSEIKKIKDFIKTTNEKGNLELIYNSKKYGIVCERRFEVDSNSMVIGFVSNGCF